MILPCASLALARLDLLLYREVLRLRASYQLSLDEFRGLFISDDQVDALVRDTSPEPDATVETLEARAESLAEPARALLRADERWSHVANEFVLNDAELDVLLLALASELAVKYETIFGYLNNDVTRRCATLDLALRTFGSKSGAVRASLTGDGTLFSSGLLELRPSEEARSWLSSGFRAVPVLVSFLLGLPTAAPKLGPTALRRAASAPDLSELGLAQSEVERFAGLARLWSRECRPPWVVLEGEPGSGRETVAAAALGRGQRDLLVIDLATLTGDPKAAASEVAHLVLRARLWRAGLLLRGLERFAVPEVREHAVLSAVLETLSSEPVPVAVAVSETLPWRALLGRAHVLTMRLEEPDAAARERLWTRALKAEGLAVRGGCAEVADRFALNGGRIRAAARSLRFRHALADNGHGELAPAELFEAAREHSVGDIGKLAQKVKTLHGWEDLVLPGTTRERVQEIVAAVRHRSRVYREWGLRLGTGSTGLLVLFAGASGTGKTMTASLIAGEMGLDLYRIDLSSIVSKYIGETEKNLDRIFAAARRANCILFFDEADALFGKRSEVKDAHDRYANIEVAYLLQKIEVHDGVVILASNLAKNMDQAFARRVHYALEFPRPAGADREQLWRRMFGARTPIAEDVDFAFLARQFDATGGEIRTMALDAVMLAASSGGPVNMSCLVRAVARQHVKQGRMPSPAAFKQHFALLGEAVR
jgi:hypothetical protein